MDEPNIAIEHVDIAIGATICLTKELAYKSVVVLESRDSVGGTWDLFRCPGIRSDSDLHTFGYALQLWRPNAAIVDALLIREHLRATVEDGLNGLARLRHRVVSAEWSSGGER